MPQTNTSRSAILKISLFATGLSGIVAEYILSTLASYFLGDSVFQWTIILSLMLFSMGLGSRITQFIQNDLLFYFIMIEFSLSLLVSFSAMSVYLVSGFTVYTPVIIYALSICIGLLIGLEIPLVTRLNQAYEVLRVNIASVMEKDYYGSLVGGVFFAFVGLPYLGLTYTPFVLGAVNFSVALMVYFKLNNLIGKKNLWTAQIMGVFCFLAISVGGYFAEPIIFFGEQRKYKDKVIFQHQSRYQHLVITQWQNNYWFFIDGSQQFCTLDEVMYHEPLVHPVMTAHLYPQDILVLGGGDGLVARELLKYPSVKSITIVDIDKDITDLAKTHPVFLKVNQKAMLDKRVKIINQDAFQFLANTSQFFDIIICDLPDPRNIELNRLFSQEFYGFCFRQLRPEGLLITQAGSPYYATKAFKCIDLTLQHVGFSTLPMHNQILTMGEWGFLIGSKKIVDRPTLKKRFQNLRFDHIDTQFLTQEAMLQMTSFGKLNVFISPDELIEINTLQNPVLYRYYLKGSWDLY
ncbi:MAG: polyamine aminopropyltransferase [Microscillaceae bacterium]|nr:polyamine aminopropyltransferase [Microscillaceae bacterium]MDW8459634.1 polyamine aminopropyltransferase [Cytophagales bacterium]